MDGFNGYFFSFIFISIFKSRNSIVYCVILIIKETLEHIWKNNWFTIIWKLNHILCIPSSFSLYRFMLCRSFSFTCIIKQKLIKGVTQETSVYNIYYWLKEIKKILIGLEMLKYKWLFLEGFFFQLTVFLVDIF